MKKFQRRAHLGKLAVVVALLATTVVMVAGPASATTMTTLYVASTGTATTGCTDSSPCRTINDGVMAAYALEDLKTTSVTIDVAAGTYDENDFITVLSGDTITLEGAGAGSTIVNGTGSGTVFTVTSGFQVSPGVLIIDGFTIEDGNGQGGGVDNDGTLILTNDTLSGDVGNGQGGGVYNQSGAIATLTNDAFSSDSAINGAGVGNSGTATLTNDTFSSNSAADDGGGVYNDGGATATLTSDTFSSDSALNGASVGGGGGVANFGIVTMTSDTLSSDTASTGIGGGIYNDGTVTLANDTLSNNSAMDGGGVYNSDTVTLTNDTLSGDWATLHGGGVFNAFNAGITTLTSDTLSGDSATYGAGVYNGGTVTLTSDTLSNGSAADGAGVYNAATATLTNDTLFGDSATTDGGGVYNSDTVTLTNDTLSNDTAPTDNGGGIYNQSGTATLANSILDTASCSGSIGDAGYNVESDDSCGFGSSDLTSNSSINLATSLAANGSSGPETLAIGANSSAFEEVPSNCIGTDERGLARPGLTGQLCDAGAYEAQPQTVTLYVATNGGATTRCTESSPCTTIQEGVTAAELYVGSVTVHVAAGLYGENDIIAVPSGDTLTLDGAGAGSTIADGIITGSSVFTVNSGAVTIDGFRIGDGDATSGGGVYNDGAVTLTNDTFSDDSADFGGGVYNDSRASATLANDTFSTDTASYYGGGVYNNSTATLANDTLSNDTAMDGGGVFNDADGTATLSNDTLTNDVASDGGGVYNDGTATLTNDTVSNDSAPTNYGGGVANNDIITLTNDTLSGDSAELGGGFYNAYDATLTNDTLSGDSATTDGGGVYNGTHTATLTFDTLSNDAAPIDNGGGVYNQSGTATLANSILDAASCSGSIGDDGYNVESDDTCVSGANDVTSATTAINLAASLAANGSSGPETLAIGPGSSAFDEVPASACATVTTDERGDPRPGQLGQSACDAGAYEYQRAVPRVHMSQSIDFRPLASVSMTSTNVDLSATATSGLAVTFTSSTPSVCTVNDVTVSMLAIGTCSITASQAGDAVFTAAPTVTQTFSVTAAPPTLPGPPVIMVISPFKGRLRITLTSPASAARSYQYSLDGRAWVKLAGNGPFTLSGLAHVVVSVRVRGVNIVGSGRASNARRVRVRP